MGKQVPGRAASAGEHGSRAGRARTTCPGPGPSHTLTHTHALHSRRNQTGTHRLRPEPRTISHPPGPSRREHRHARRRSCRHGCRRREGERAAAAVTRRRQQPRRAAATPSAGRAGDAGGGSHFSSPAITRTRVPRAGTVHTRRSATLLLLPARGPRPGRGHRPGGRACVLFPEGQTRCPRRRPRAAGGSGAPCDQTQLRLPGRAVAQPWQRRRPGPASRRLRHGAPTPRAAPTLGGLRPGRPGLARAGGVRMGVQNARRGSRGGPRPPRPARALTFLEAGALPSSGGRSPEHVRGGRGAVRGTRSQAPQRAAPPSPGSAPRRGRCHLVPAAERKRRDTRPRPRLLLLWLLSAGPVSLIFLPGIWVGSVAGATGARPTGRPPAAGPTGGAGCGARGGRGPCLTPLPRAGGARRREARAAGPPLGLLGSPHGRPSSPGSCPAAPVRPLLRARRLRSATARPAAQRAEPGGPAPLRSGRGAPRSPSPGPPAGSRALGAPGGRRGPDRAPPPQRRPPAAVPSLAVPGPTPPKTGILKNTQTPKEG